MLDLVGVTIDVRRVFLPIAPDAPANTGEEQAVDIVINTLPGVSFGVTPVTISVVSGPDSGNRRTTGEDSTERTPSI